MHRQFGTSVNLRRRALAAVSAGLFGAASWNAQATTHTVDNCNESGPGSLRAVVGAGTTHSGDTIDFSGLSCGTITLTTGAIVVQQAALDIVGPGAGQLTITRDPGQGKQRIFKHQPGLSADPPMLTLSYLTVSGGYYGGAAVNQARGGCVYSTTQVTLDHVRMTDCTVTAANEARGGGIFAADALTIRHSTLSGNTAQVGASATQGAYGGGAAVFAGSIDVVVADIIDNFAIGNFASSGGGLDVAGELDVRASAVRANLSSGPGGGLAVRTDCSHLGCAGGLQLTNSTISGNQANLAGGVYAAVGQVLVQASTIAFNNAHYGSKVFNVTPHYVAAGMAVVAGAVELESSLFANNVYGTPAIFDSDFSQFGVGLVTGADNLIRNDTGAGPAGSMQGACPRLGLLRDNGGPTQTHALLSGSLAIDAGNDSAGANYDQRGDPFVRDNGPADIGAYEVQGGIIFNASFDGCAILP